jgi:SpoIID/LytB domain protein
MIRPIRSLRRSILPAVFLVFALCIAAPSVAWAADPIFQFTGRGNGHGVGMSQWGAKGMAEQGWGYKQILAHYYQGSWVATWPGATTIHVNLDPSVTPGKPTAHTSWTLGPGHLTSSQLSVTFGGNTYTGIAGHIYRFEALGTAIQVWDTTSNSQWSVGAAGVIPAGTLAEVAEVSGVPPLTKVYDGSGYGDVVGKTYRGTLEVSNSGGKVKLVNHLGVEGYIYGVIPLETGYTWGEATKAQAVAARGYALTLSGELYCTTYSQVYGGYAVEQPESNAAADATYGQVVFANDPGPVAIRTYFFSSSGGHTENVENVWGGVGKSHYAGVDDPYEYLSGSGYFIWYDHDTFKGQPAYSGPILRQKLLNYGISVPAVITDVIVTSRGVSERVKSLTIKGASGDDKVLNTPSQISAFKNALGWGDTWFYVTRFEWDSPVAQVPPGGSTVVRFKVSPPVTCDIRGLVKDGVDTGIVLHAVDGIGEAVISQTGTYWVDGLIYNRANAAGKPDPAQGDLRGTPALFRNATNKLGVTLGAAPSATAITISSTATSVRRGKSFILQGVLRPGVPGMLVHAEVKKPGKAYWTYSSARLTYGSATGGGTNWWYRYDTYSKALRRNIPAGTYYFRVRFAGDATHAACLSPNTIKVVVK